MNATIIALICAAGFGVVVAITTFVRQLILSRDKSLNDEAHRRAIAQEASELEKLRNEMHDNRRFDSHYKVLGTNKDAIVYLDTEINELLDKKKDSITRYSQVFFKESEAIIDGRRPNERKETHDKLKAQMDAEIQELNEEIAKLQARRASLWDAHSGFQNRLLKQENTRNSNLDALYKQHSSVLEKIYLRHSEDSEHVARDSIAAGTTSFKDMIMAPIQFLTQYFGFSNGIALDQARIEQASRGLVAGVEGDINQSSSPIEASPFSPLTGIPPVPAYNRNAYLSPTPGA